MCFMLALFDNEQGKQLETNRDPGPRPPATKPLVAPSTLPCIPRRNILVLIKPNKGPTFCNGQWSGVEREYVGKKACWGIPGESGSAQLLTINLTAASMAWMCHALWFALHWAGYKKEFKARGRPLVAQSRGSTSSLKAVAVSQHQGFNHTPPVTQYQFGLPTEFVTHQSNCRSEMFL